MGSFHGLFRVLTPSPRTYNLSHSVLTETLPSVHRPRTWKFLLHSCAACFCFLAPLLSLTSHVSSTQGVAFLICTTGVCSFIVCAHVTKNSILCSFQSSQEKWLRVIGFWWSLPSKLSC